MGWEVTTGGAQGFEVDSGYCKKYENDFSELLTLNNRKQQCRCLYEHTYTQETVLPPTELETSNQSGFLPSTHSDRQVNRHTDKQTKQKHRKEEQLV